MNAIMKRKSVRDYQLRSVDPDKIERILMAAMQAPSAGNQQPWEFIVVRDKAMLVKLSDMSPYSGMIKNADVAIVLLSNKEFVKFPENVDQDMSACTENILLQVVEEGLGAVWLGAAPLKDRIDYLVKILDLSDNLTPFAVVPIGYPMNETEVNVRYNASRVHCEKY